VGVDAPLQGPGGLRANGVRPVVLQGTDERHRQVGVLAATPALNGQRHQRADQERHGARDAEPHEAAHLIQQRLLWALGGEEEGRVAQRRLQRLVARQGGQCVLQRVAAEEYGPEGRNRVIRTRSVANALGPSPNHSKRLQQRRLGKAFRLNLKIARLALRL